MDYIFNALIDAVEMIISFDRELISVVSNSLKLSITSTIIASLIGVPFGIFIGRTKFWGRHFINSVLNTLLSLPTVVVGIFVYSLISRRGILGKYDLLFSFWGIVFGQILLIIPITTALTRNTVYELEDRMIKTAISIGANSWQRFVLILSEIRYGIIGAIVTAFGRVIGEVGISMMLGGNIKGVTRTITTAMALETHKGQFSFGMALGLILLLISFLLNFIIYYLQIGENNNVRQKRSNS